ncbi:hypothetical protein QF026_000142 [Streptomyces aurantiacus]|nr:hypothetical protein [Streptomyces aurantiacus]
MFTLNLAAQHRSRALDIAFGVVVALLLGVAAVVVGAVLL